jgi:hypothetical protein
MEARRIFRLDNNRKPYAKIEIRARSLRTNNEERTGEALSTEHRGALLMDD